ncbi:MAG: alanine racemase [Thalassotalea sp.]|nr:alanine racemase [Thalassotalea sp.]
MTLRTATATIDLQALINNFSYIKQKAPDSKVLAVLKANAYGHGLECIAKALSQFDHQADAFGVARLDEALALRTAGINKPIVLLEGFFNIEDLDVIAENNLQTIIHSQEQLITLCTAKLENPVKVWLKIDTGMHRLGINPEEFQYYYSQLTTSKNVDSSIVLMSHLGCADDTENKNTDKQIALFEEVTDGLSDNKSLANSAGIDAWYSSHYQWVRPGLLLYGISPMQKISTTQVFSHSSLVPVMTLQSSIIAVRQIDKEEPVGYGGAWKSDKITTIGVIAIGYGDGYPRHAINGTPVLLNGRIVPLVGRVSMDMITVDLGDSSKDKVGDIATLWGKDLPVEEVATWATTIPYELLCNISRRVQISVK